MEYINHILDEISSLLWDYPMIILLVGTHLYLTIRLRFPQRKILTAIKLSVAKDKDGDGDVSQFGALATALAATIGTGNIIGVGTHFMGFDEDFSGALFYRVGQYFTLHSRWSLSGDLGYFHVETFQKNSDEAPERLFSLQARLNVDYQLTRIIGAFASVGYGNTRYYKHAKLYRQRMLAEMGFTFRLVKSEKIKN